MARTDTLTNYLTDIATVIKEKKGTETPINASKFDEEINELVNKNYYIDATIAENLDTDYLISRLIVRVPPIDTSHMTSLKLAFQRCTYLTEIPELDCGKVNDITSAFANTSRLEKLGGLKDIGKAFDPTQSANYSKYTVTISYSEELTHESLMNVINGLYDIASLGVQTQKLDLHATNISLLTPEEIAIATAKGWSVS